MTSPNSLTPPSKVQQMAGAIAAEMWIGRDGSDIAQLVYYAMAIASIGDPEVDGFNVHARDAVMRAMTVMSCDLSNRDLAFMVQELEMRKAAA